MRDALRKALKRNGKAGVALVGIILLGTLVGSYILSNQRLNPPEWMPIVGEDTFELKAELESAQGVLPGQGQAVNVSGVRVGDIQSVELEDGQAVATLRIESRFATVYPDATVLLRPKTGLKDMVIELDPGSKRSGEKLEDGETISNDSTLPDASPEEFLSALDADTQAYLRLLLGDGGRALGDGGGRDLANTFRRLQPLSRDFDRASRYVARRRAKLKRVTHNFSTLMTELGAHDRQIARFVGSSAAVFRRFANQNDNLASTVDLLPAALQSGNTALAKLDRLGQSMQRTFTDLRPTAKALGPTLRQIRPSLAATTPVIRDQLRPFAREVKPIVRELRTPARDLSKVVPNLITFTEVFNALFNELAYDPPGEGKGKEPYLFYLPWANHNTNSLVANQDGMGPIRRGLLFVSRCDADFLERTFLRRPDKDNDVPSDPNTLPPKDPARVLNPAIATLVELAKLPTIADYAGLSLKDCVAEGG